MTHSQFSDKRMFFVTLRKTLRKNAFQCTALTLLMLAVLNAENMSTLFDLYYYSNTDYLSEMLAETLQMHYIIGTRWADPVTIAMIMLVFGISALLYVLYNFRFMHTKKTVNVYYSLGIKRKTLFAGKLVGCAVSQLIAVYIPFAACFALNLYLHGFSPELLKACLYYSLCLAVIALYPLAICIFSMTNTGSTAEGMLCGLILAFAPTLLFYGTFLNSETFLAGTGYDIRMYFKDSGDYFINEFGGRLAFFDLFYPFNNDSFTDALALEAADPFVLPSFAYPLFYAGIFILFSVAAGFSFVRQKTEKAGFLASSPKLLAATLFFLGILLIPFCAFLLNGNYISAAACAIISFLLCGVAFGLYIGIIAILLRSKEKIKAQLRTGGILAGALAVFLLVFLTGGLGYTSRIPDTDSVVSAGITFTAGEGAVTADNAWLNYDINDSYYEHQDDDDAKIDFLSQLLNSTDIWGSSSYVEFKDPAAIETIRSIHTALLKDRINRRGYVWGGEHVLIRYTLKNGATVTRAYQRWTPDALTLSRSLLKTDEYTDACADYLYRRKGSDTFLFSKNGMLETNILTMVNNPTTVLNNLYDALCTDIRQGNLPLDFISPDSPMGYIGISKDSGDLSDFKQRITDYMVADSTMFLPVTESMKATLTVLTQAGLTQYFEDSHKPVRARVYPCPFNDSRFYETYKHFFPSQQFNGFVVNNDFWGEKLSEEEQQMISRFPNGATTVTDEDLLEELCANSSFSYFISEPGYFAELYYNNEENGTRTDAMVYIPIDRMPQELLK